MILSLVIAVSLLGQPGPMPPVCEVCGTRLGAIEGAIHNLKTSHRPRDRADAAADLARFPWTCHPEVVQALSDALMFDPKDKVREQAADSLAKLRACDPQAYFALRKAAVADRDGGVRRRARQALAALPTQRINDVIVYQSVTSRRVSPPIEMGVPGSVRIIESNPTAVLDPVETEDPPPPPPAAFRRSSAKPVIPPPDLPPLEGPAR